MIINIQVYHYLVFWRVTVFYVAERASCFTKQAFFPLEDDIPPTMDVATIFLTCLSTLPLVSLLASLLHWCSSIVLQALQPLSVVLGCFILYLSHLRYQVCISLSVQKCHLRRDFSLPLMLYSKWPSLQ